jgi:phage/conjugal plasmid C-4 type zinc finger TraR family protein
VGDEIDRAQANDEFFLSLALKNHPHPAGHPLLIQEGDRGICIDCDEPIPEARRRAVPGCTRCINCQTEFERRTP